MEDVRPNPTISIVMAVFGEATVLDASLDRLAAQTYGQVDLVVIDGGSTDGTRDLLERRSADIDSWVSEPDRGIYQAWNKGLAHARGDWLTFMGADDEYASPDSLEWVAAALAKVDDRVSIAYGRLDLVAADKRVLRHLGQPWPEIRAGFRQSMTIPHPAAFYRASYFADNGGFDESFRIVGDYEIMLRTVFDRPPVFLDGPVIVRMTEGGVSDRPENYVKRANEFYRAAHMHGLTRAPRQLSPLVVRAQTDAAIRKVFGPRVADRFVRGYRAVVGRSR
jgi:glycosyltransferase involved in cell wall biosynthesis